MSEVCSGITNPEPGPPAPILNWILKLTKVYDVPPFDPIRSRAETSTATLWNASGLTLSPQGQRPQHILAPTV